MGEQWINPIGHNEKLSETLIQTLIETAVKQLRFSYTPYSHFKVGAALLAADGTIYIRMQYRECGLYADKLCGENGFLQGCQRRGS